MNNRFLQFIKKQRLAIRLARFDSLFLILGLKAFRGTIHIAKLFIRKSKQKPLVRFQKFLLSENNPLLFALYDEFTCRTDLLPYESYLLPIEQRTLDGEVCIRSTTGLRDIKFFLNLCEEIVTDDYPELMEQFKLFKQRLDAVFDMRFYASELEMLCGEVGGFERGCPFEINWLKTGRNELWLDFPKKYDFSGFLFPKTQESLSKLIAYLIFDKKIFMSLFKGVGYNHQSRVCLPEIDYLYPVSAELQTYAVNCIMHRQKPKTILEHKMQRLLFLLEDYCPDIKVFEIWKDYLKQDYRHLPPSENRDTELLNLFNSCGIEQCTRQPVVLTNPNDIAWLLDSQRHLKNPQFKNSTFRYWGPLVVAIGLSLYLF